ncbi:hypothetical protein [Zooshikella ganghwensis]|uniref:hypothetical protein n=1 Tax=Zooshikella ganghwensis TaxID=202772 RepID=UPI00041D5AA3|nr:hypothetical protein [Zooshikella ganghwensis]
MKLKKLAKKLGYTLALSTLMSSSIVFGSGGTGVPTSDVALYPLLEKIAEGNKKVLEQLSDNEIAKLIELYGKLDDQYKKLSAEYEHLQRIAHGLKTIVKDPEQLKRLAYERLVTNRSVYDDIQLYDKNGVYNADEGVKRIYQRVLGTSEVGRQLIPDRYRDKGFTSAMREKELANYDRDFQRSRLADIHAFDVKDLETKRRSAIKRSSDLDELRRDVALDNNNELATLQLMALQNQHIFENLQVMQEIQQKQFEHSNKFSDFIFAKQAQGRLERIERIQRALNQSPTKIDNTGRW